MISRKKIKHSDVKTSASSSHKLLWVNVGLLTTVCLFLAFYIVKANHLASLNYQIQNLEVEISGLSEENATLTAQKIIVDDPSYLAAFARERGLVEANPTHVFGGSGVALRQ